MSDAYLTEIKLRIPEEENDALLLSYLEQAEYEVRNVRNYADDTVPTEARWKYIIIELAEFLYNTNGANGEKSHEEPGGTKVSFRTKQEILQGVSALVRVV